MINWRGLFLLLAVMIMAAAVLAILQTAVEYLLFHHAAARP